MLSSGLLVLICRSRHERPLSTTPDSRQHSEPPDYNATTFAALSLFACSTQRVAAITTPERTSAANRRGAKCRQDRDRRSRFDRHHCAEHRRRWHRRNTGQPTWISTVALPPTTRPMSASADRARTASNPLGECAAIKVGKIAARRLHVVGAHMLHATSGAEAFRGIGAFRLRYYLCEPTISMFFAQSCWALTASHAASRAIFCCQQISVVSRRRLGQANGLNPESDRVLKHAGHYLTSSHHVSSGTNLNGRPIGSANKHFVYSWS